MTYKLLALPILLILVLPSTSSLPISVGMIYTDSSRHGMIYKIGLPANSLAIFFEQTPVMSFWGEARIRNGTETIVLAPTYGEDILCKDLGVPSLLTSRYIASYGGRIEGGVGFVEWVSKDLKLLNNTVGISWVGHGILLSVNDGTALVMLQARMNVSTSTSVEGLERLVELAPLTTILDLDSVDVYAFGVLRSAPSHEMLTENEILEYTKNRSIVAAVLAVHVKRFNLTMIFSGALIGRFGTSKNVLKVYLGIVRSSPSNSMLSTFSQLFIVITKLGIDRVLKILQRAVRLTLNPMQIVSMVWRYLVYGSPQHSGTAATQGVVQTVTMVSITTIKIVDPVLTSTITVVSVCIGVVLGFLLGRRFR